MPKLATLVRPRPPTSAKRPTPAAFARLMREMDVKLAEMKAQADIMKQWMAEPKK